MDYVNSIMEKIHQENKLCLVMGDFNIDLLKIESHSGSDDFLDMIGSYFFQPYILQPTRVRDHSATLIDNIFFNSIEHYVISGNLTYSLSDHLPNFIIIKKIPVLPRNVRIYRRDYSNFNKAALINDIEMLDWQLLLGTTSDPSIIFDRFYSSILEVIDQHIPIKQMSRKELKLKSKPWITSAIKKSILVKNKLHKNFLKTKSAYYFSKFKYYRNKLNHLLKIQKRKYYNEYFIKNLSDSKRVWKGIKQIIHVKPQTDQSIIKLIDNGREITENDSIANTFNKYFCKIGEELATQVPKIQTSPFSFLSNKTYNSLSISPVTAGEIEIEIANLNSSKAVGPFSIPLHVLKLLKGVLSKPLEILFNASFTTGIVPNKFKLGNIIPVYKSGSRNNIISNYRPISMLSVFNKLLEKLMCKRLVSYIDSNNIFSETQFGFRSNHSTDHTILSTVDKIQKAIDER